jgi:hypothetical protein
MDTESTAQSVSTINVAGGNVCVVVIAGGRVEVVEVKEKVKFWKGITVKGALTLGVDVVCPPASVNT